MSALTIDLEKETREAKLDRVKEEFYTKIQLGLPDEYFDQISWFNFFDSDGNVKKNS